MLEYLVPSFWIVVGLCVLLLGGELLVRGASGLAGLFRVSPLIIGLTVVAFGTSAPELAVVLQSSFAGKTDLAIGNVVGSCIFNVLFVLGLTAVVCPLVVSARLVRLEVPLMIAASMLLFLFGLDGRLGRVDGLLLSAGLVVYMIWTVVQGRKESHVFQDELEEIVETRAAAPKVGRFWPVATKLGFVACGLFLLVFGSQRLVDGSVTIAHMWGLSELFIGLTILAVGTSLPEIATSILATLKGQGDIAVGNIVGSNILNILAVLGLSSMVAPNGIRVSAEALHLDIPVMIAVSVACLPIFFTSYRINRWEGYLFFGFYLAYTAYLILTATLPVGGRVFGLVMLVFVVPLTLVTLIIGVVRDLQAGPGSRGVFAWIPAWFGKRRGDRTHRGKKRKRRRKKGR